jgi:di/tricarboxylate transporter
MKQTLLLLPLLALVSGCMSVRDSVPATELHGYIGGHPFSFVGPKDLTLGTLAVIAETNGSVSMVVSNLTAKTSPEIITTTADAQAKITAAQGQAIINAIQAGASLVPK